nr:hypothetical protein BaRGS_023431 [Batillaria attramentaria]
MLAKGTLLDAKKQEVEIPAGGFAFLPFLWFVNSVWFFNEAFRKPAYEQQKMIRTWTLDPQHCCVRYIGKTHELAV